MRLDSIVIGERVPEDFGRNARRVEEGLQLAEERGALSARWELTLREERVVKVALSCFGPWEELAAEYEGIVEIFATRHGAPSRAPPDEDDQRHVDLPPEGLPGDRYWILRSRQWAGPIRASAYLCKVWPASLELTASAEISG
jgi:hypothetical protein